MHREKQIYLAKIAAVLSVLPVLIYAYSFGAPRRSTGAPGDDTCFTAGCHQAPGSTLIRDSSAIQLDPGRPDMTYVPGGGKVRWTVTISDPQAVVFGFQLTARLESDTRNGQAGDFEPADSSTQVLCDDGSLKTATQPCRPGVTVQFVGHSVRRTSGTFSFDWTPPATNVGNVLVWIAANAANGNGMTSGDRIHLAGPFVLRPAAIGPRPTIAQGGAVNAWSSRPTISSGAWMSIYGQNLAPTTRTWRASEIVSGVLPTQLDGVSVKINNRDAFVYYISPTQINVQAPDDDTTGMVPVVVATPNGTSDPVMVEKQRIAPALFTWAGVVPDGQRYVGALFPDSDFSGRPWVGRPGLLAPLNIPTRPARPGEFVLLFATGCGDTNPAQPAGRVVSGAPRLTNPVAVRIGGVPAEVFENTGFLIFAGECQFNVRIPDVPDGDQRVELQIGGVETQQEVYITVQR
ncbi:MAG: choice-of-anchor V domain-containing protein [Bryobacterales bacterium]|nr:choice-of-anchor V domain-containing protein [Bryobacterales bacterium]